MKPSITVAHNAVSRRGRKVALAVGAVGLAAAVVVSVLPPGNAGTASPSRRTIASSRAHDFRVVLSAIKGAGSGAPSATVEITAYKRSQGSWKRLGGLRVGRRDGFFWKVVTRPGSVRQFSLGDARPRQASARLLISASIGWTKLFRFHVRNGELVRG